MSQFTGAVKSAAVSAFRSAMALSMAAIVFLALPGCDARIIEPEPFSVGMELMPNASKGNGGRQIDRLIVSPGSSTIGTVGGSAQLSVTALDRNGATIPNPNVTWISLDPSVARVNAKGRVTALVLGSGRIVAAADGVADTARVDVGSSVHHVPPSLVSDCSVDVTASLHTWIASVPDNSTLAFGQNACYNIDGGMVIDDRNGLTFEGNGSTFRFFTQGHGQRANWMLRGGSNLTFRNMIARGANPQAGLGAGAYVPSLEWQHAWRFRATQGAVLDNVQAYDMYGDFVNLSHDARVPFPGEPNRNIVVRNSRFERNGRYGITVTNGEDVLFENNYIGDTHWSHFNVELNGPTEAGRNIRVEGNRFGAANHFVFVSAGHGFTGRVGNILVRGNVMEADLRTCMPPIGMFAPEGRFNPDGTPLFWSGLVVENNVFRVPTGGWVADLARIRNVVIRNNQVTSNTHWGCSHDHPIRLVDSHEVSITGNTFRTMCLVHGRFWNRVFAADSLSTGVAASGNIVD
jgi:hypothetical protein